MITAATRLAAAGALALLATACMSPGDFRCTEHAQCVIANLAGTCEANGRCSIGDTKCPISERRYAHRAGDDSDACVPPSCEDNAITLPIATGGGHACLARADGSLWCWGRNDHGQLGDGSRTPRALPVRVPGISHPQAIAAGDRHTCAAQSNGTVLCWGADDTGQLGDGAEMDQGLPREVPGIANVKALAAGKDFTCALGQDGSVRCWGDDSAGQLGDGGSAEARRPPALVAALSTNVIALSASWQHACAIDAAKKLMCWGANGVGQIGDGTTIGPRAPTTPMAPLPAEVTAVAAGHDHTCAFAGGEVYCWGENAQGQVLRGKPSMAISTPVSPGMGLGDPSAVVAGEEFTCIKGGGDPATGSPITCWGADDSGQLGGGTPIKNATTVAAGAAFACAVAADGAVFCWGDNHFGQLAIGGDTVRPTAAPVPGLAHVGALAAGGAHNCATAADAAGAPALFCWGANGSSQLGNLSSADAPAPTRVSSLQPIGIAAGQAHTCAFAADRQLRCWGAGAAGQLGQPPGMDMVITSPTVTDLGGLAGGDGVYAVAAGAAHTCVGATISASLLCFGLNSDGQLGKSVQDAPGGPNPVPSLLSRNNFTALAAGDAHSCALDGGVVSCWGAGDQGQLGDGSIDGHATPAAVTLGNGVTTADTVVTGAAHTCALADGSIICWGRNAEGQVGTPLQMPIVAPTAVDEIVDAVAVAAGARHTCAIEGDATVRCWGANESGQLGDGTVDSSNKPVRVAGLTSVDAIVAGGSHSCARRTDGSVWCWGSNTSGQLGDGITLASRRALLARAACR